MKLPELKSKNNKLRDAKICILYTDELLTAKKISDMFNLSERHVLRIVRKHKDVIKDDIDWEKLKRKVWLKREIKNSKPTKKDVADLQEQLKKEFEGESPTSKETHYHFTNVNIGELKNRSENELVEKLLKRR